MSQITEAAQIVSSGTRVVHQDDHTTVIVDDVVFPDGHPGTYTTVTPGTGFGALVIARARSRHGAYYGLVRQFRFPLGEETLEFPRGGTRDLNQAEALRELVEELGVDPATELIQLGVVHPDSGLLTTKFAVWLATLPEVPSREHVEAQTGGRSVWLSEGQLMGHIRNGDIVCGMTLAAFGLLEASGRRVLPY